MKITEIRPNIYRLTVSVPLNVEEVNVYLFSGAVPTLLDTGTNTPQVLLEIRDGMKKVGMKRLEQVIISHWHVDHGGGAQSFAKEGAKVLISSRDYLEWTKFLQGTSFTLLQDWAHKHWGVPQEKVEEMGYIYRLLNKLTILPETVRFIEDEQLIQTGDYSLQALHTPGHTPGHLAFFEESKQILFSGDVLLPNQIPYPGVWEEGDTMVSGMPSYFNSINRIESLQICDYFPAHGISQECATIRCQNVKQELMTQLEKHRPQKTVYDGASNLGGTSPSSLFFQLHYVYGWESLQLAFHKISFT